MPIPNPSGRLPAVMLILLAAAISSAAAEPTSPSPAETSSLTLVVMDPLAAPLACDCVEGYANRQYERLAEHLTKSLGREVRVVYSETFDKTTAGEKIQSHDIVIGKDSVVRHAADEGKRKVEPVAALTGLDGSTMQHGLFVVRSDNPAATLLDVEGFTVFFGPENCDEKWSAPRQLLSDLEISVSDKSKCFDACSVAAKALMALSDAGKSAAVISSYAAPLLEGCGTIQKGDLKVIGESEPVRFVSAFVAADLPENLKQQISETLLAVGDPQLLKALETKQGFVAYGEE